MNKQEEKEQHLPTSHPKYYLTDDESHCIGRKLWPFYFLCSSIRGLYWSSDKSQISATDFALYLFMYLI